MEKQTRNTWIFTVNTYLDIPEEIAEETYINIDFLRERTRIKGSEAEERELNGVLRKVATATAYAKLMREPVTITMSDEEGNPVKLQTISGKDRTDGYTFTIEQYLDAIKNDSNANLADFAEKMNIYGIYAQKLLGYKTEQVEDLNPDVSEVTVDKVAEWKPWAEGSVTGLELNGASMMLLSETNCRVYYKVEGDISDYKFYINDKEVSLEENGEGNWYVEQQNIAAKELDKEIIFSVKKGTEEYRLSYNAMSYVYNVVRKAEQNDENLVKMCQALYLYNQAAKAYFGD